MSAANQPDPPEDRLAGSVDLDTVIDQKLRSADPDQVVALVGGMVTFIEHWRRAEVEHLRSHG
jgi:hypothetical protein